MEEWMRERKCPNCGIGEAEELKIYKGPFAAFRRPDLPRWYSALLTLSLLPILAWPLVALSSVFLFDSGNVAKAMPLVIAMDIYPLYILGLRKLSLMAFRKNPVVAALIAALPLIPVAFLVWELCSDWFSVWHR
jgi:hypothetical protein